MPPRDAGVEWETASPQSTTVAPSVVAVPAERIPTGARLGWWRSLLGVGAVLVGVRYLVWQASIAPATVLGVLFVAAEATSVVVLAVTVLTLLDRGSRERASASVRLARRLRHRVRRASRGRRGGRAQRTRDRLPASDIRPQRRPDRRHRRVGGDRRAGGAARAPKRSPARRVHAARRATSTTRCA